MPLKVIIRKDTGALTIDGWITFSDGSRERIRQRAQSDDRKLAEEEAASLEARKLRDAWHGERRGARPFSQAVESYLRADNRRAATIKRLIRIMRALGDPNLAAVNQEAIDRVRDMALRPNASPATVRAEIITPIRAVLNHAHRRGWCDPPHFDLPKQPEGRTLYMLPNEARRLVQPDACRHLRALLVFLLGTGARMTEALSLEWRDTDLQGARAIFQAATTKGRQRRRIAALPPAVVAVLASLPHREGKVFRTPSGAPYADKDGAGGQIKTAWSATIRRSGLNPALRPHDLRHTWASWHYAINRDLLALKIEGGWQTIEMVQRYAHLMPRGHESEILAFWGVPAMDTRETRGAIA